MTRPVTVTADVTVRHNRRHAPRALAVPLVLVNTFAIYGQAGWAHDHITSAALRATHPSVAALVSLLFAVTVESVGVYLAVEAHDALMAGDASARLRLASYAAGLLVGALNYAHFAAPGHQPTALAVTFGLLSCTSPWLWAIRSRALNRDRLRTLGQVDPRAVRFAPLRWALYPMRTWKAFRAAVWAGVVVPADAVALTEPPTKPVRRTPVRDTPQTGDSDTAGDDSGDLTARVQARRLYDDGVTRIPELLLRLGLPNTDANRRKLYRWVKPVRAVSDRRAAGGASR